MSLKVNNLILNVKGNVLHNLPTYSRVALFVVNSVCKSGIVNF